MRLQAGMSGFIVGRELAQVCTWHWRRMMVSAGGQESIGSSFSSSSVAQSRCYWHTHPFLFTAAYSARDWQWTAILDPLLST